MRRIERLASLALLLWLIAGVALATPGNSMSLAAPENGMTLAAPKIGVATMEPGEIFWERFGHNAIVVVDPATTAATSYNFGYFDLDEPGFIGNFIKGQMQYRLVALPLDQDLSWYRDSGRGVSVQWLHLDEAQATRLAAALADNARPENARYHYDYYTSNCSTRVRDALDAALDGALNRQLSGRSRGNTYRSESVRLAAPAPWMAIGFHLGLSDYADRPLSRWDEAFIPMRLREGLREVKRADGQPLVEAEAVIVPHRLGLPPEEAPRLRGQAFLAGLLLAALTLWLGRRQPRLLTGLAGAFWLVAGLLGVGLVFIWFGSAHVAVHGNENLLLLSPLCLGLLPGAWARLRGREPGRTFHTLLLVVTGMAMLAGFLRFLPFRPQENLEWVMLLLPLHWALLKTFGRATRTNVS